MTIDELRVLRAAYPGCPDAVVAHEDPTITGWPAARQRGYSPRQAIEQLKQCADDVLAVPPGGLLAEIREQMDHPDFARYVAAKLGGM